MEAVNVNVQKLLAEMVGEVVEEPKSMERNQVGGATLTELGRRVENARGWAKGVVSNVTLDLSIPKAITIDPNGPELFAESLVTLVKKYAPRKVGHSTTRAGLNFTSDEILESVGLPFKDINRIKASDIVQSMAEMSQSNRSPLQLEVPRVSVRITYITPPVGSGKKRKFDVASLLELTKFGGKKRRQVDEEEDVCDLIDDEAGEGSEEEEEEEEEEDDEEEDDEEEECAQKDKQKRGSTNIMKNNVTRNCLFHALHQAHMWQILKLEPSRENKNKYRSSLRKNEDRPDSCKDVFLAVKRMKKEAGIQKRRDFDWYDVERLQKTVFAGTHQILVFEQNSTIPFFSGPFVGEDKVLVLYLANDHYSGVRSVCNLLKTSYFCALCLTKSRDAASHYNCKLKHYTCGSKDCPTTKDDVPEECEKCHIVFRSKTCLENHLERGERGGKSRCEQTKFCNCCKTAYFTNKKMNPHKCGEKFCKRCLVTRENGHACSMMPSVKNEDSIKRKRIFFDIESRVDDKTGKQIPVLFIGIRCCPECSHHIPKTHIDALEARCKNCAKDGRVKIIESISPENRYRDVSEEMTEWLFGEDHKGFVSLAHNGSGYDAQFILERLISSRKSAPEICIEGTKLIYLKYKQVKMIDSLKYLTMSLSAVGKAFEIDSMKGDFPVLFIKEENYDYEGPLPGDEYYALNNKSVDAKNKIADFLATERAAGTVFNFFDEIVKYCYNDCYILASAMTMFEKEFEAMTDVCIFEESVTAASAAAKVFRRNFLDPYMPIVLDAKPSATINCSIMSQKYLAWIGHKEDVQMEISGTYGEKKVGEYRVDGFIPPCEKYPNGQVVEYNGCYWHGHKCTYSEDSFIGGQLVREIRRKDKMRIREIKKEYPVRIIWECQAKEELVNDPEMAEFFENYEARDILQCSRALMGGRTEVFRLVVDNLVKKVYKYVDVTSMYPAVMKHEPFPIGRPENVNRADIPVPITCRTQLPFRGFLKCKILPPRNLLIPVIGDKSTGKLVFGLCKKCIKLENQGECEHTDDERSFTNVYPTVELERALEFGYVITEVYHGVKFEYWVTIEDDGAGGLFTGYMNKMLTEKIYASGWPKNVKTEEEKKEFVAAYKEKEHIDLSDHSRFSKNLGKRAAAKLMLNSLWGKFAQRVDRDHTTIIIESSRFWRLYYDKSVVLMDVRPVNDVLVVRYRKQAESQESLKTSAMHLGALVPAYGRLYLYSAMNLVGGENIIYTDTDSIIYCYPEGEEDPLAACMGEFLGQLTDECSGKMIDFVSTGGKTYAYKEQMENGEIKVVRKAKGITLNSEADHLVTFDRMKMLVNEVLSGVKDRSTIKIPQFTMKRDRDHNVYSQNVQKAFRYTFNKRRVLPDGSTLPYGFKRD